MDKPHYGRIKDWSLDRNGPVIRGNFLDHPHFRGPDGHTSKVISINFETGEVETKNSRYTLVEEGAPSRQQDFPMKGDFMKFLNKNGYDGEREEAAKVFETLGLVYLVEDCQVGHWDHRVKFRNIDGWYNGVMFERVK